MEVDDLQLEVEEPEVQDALVEVQEPLAQVQESQIEVEELKAEVLEAQVEIVDPPIVVQEPEEENIEDISTALSKEIDQLHAEGEIPAQRRKFQVEGRNIISNRDIC